MRPRPMDINDILKELSLKQQENKKLREGLEWFADIFGEIYIMSDEHSLANIVRSKARKILDRE